MRKLIAWMLTACVMPLLAGCAEPPPADESIPEGPLFCDIEEARRFSQEEIDWRSAHAPWNLGRDLKTNESWSTYCLENPETEKET